jgi:hypothetical protein
MGVSLSWWSALLSGMALGASVTSLAYEILEVLP